MLEKPALEDQDIIACLRREYGLSVKEITFLPLGADLNTAVYRAVTDKKTPYFVKLRRGVGLSKILRLSASKSSYQIKAEKIEHRHLAF